MAQFDESKVINALHTDKAEVGKKYWYSDNLKLLKKHVEENDSECVGELKSVEEGEIFCYFYIEKKCAWELLYPYEEPQKQRMTIRQLEEWLAKGNGERKYNNSICNYWIYNSNNEYDEVSEDIHIRTWDSDEWIEPTMDIYERDCKKE